MGEPCKTCKGYGWLRFQWPRKNPTPVHWFQKPCTICGDCNGTGEKEGA